MNSSNAGTESALQKLYVDHRRVKSHRHAWPSRLSGQRSVRSHRRSEHTLHDQPVAELVHPDVLLSYS